MGNIGICKHVSIENLLCNCNLTGKTCYQYIYIFFFFFVFFLCMSSFVGDGKQIDAHTKRERDIFIYMYLYIYIYGAGLVFCLLFLAFCKAKTAYFSHFEAKMGKGKEQKGRPKTVMLFFGRKVHFFPNLSKFLSKRWGKKEALAIYVYCAHTHTVCIRLSLAMVLQSCMAIHTRPRNRTGTAN